MAGKIPTTREECEALDRADPLRARREQFALPEGVIYLDGHSLGPPTKAALARVERTAKAEWAGGLIRSWNDAGWIDLPLTAGTKLARLIGAKPNEVVVTDSVSVNLFKLAAAAMKAAPAPLIIVEESEFPTDQYVAEGLAKMTNGKLIRAAPDGGLTQFELFAGVMIKSVVNYRTAQVANIDQHEAAARQTGGIVIWDLSHATGVIDLNLGTSGAKLAVGCTYKFLNGGPGAPAFVYVRGDVAAKVRSPISGWFGHAAPFDFVSEYEPRANAARFAAGTPPILSLAALDAALDAFAGVDLTELARKTRALGDLCIARAAKLGLETISPADPGQRGGHVSLINPEGYAIVQALIARRIIGDFRAPDAMRFGFSPLFVRYADVWDAMDQLSDILATRAWDRPEFKRRAAVT